MSNEWFLDNVRIRLYRLSQPCLAYCLRNITRRKILPNTTKVKGRKEQELIKPFSSLSIDVFMITRFYEKQRSGKKLGSNFLLALRGHLRKFIEHFTEMFNKTILESHTVIGVTETPVYCSWEEVNKWITLPSGCGTGKVSVERFQFRYTSHLMKALLS